MVSFWIMKAKFCIQHYSETLIHDILRIIYGSTELNKKNQT
jgi:hypothetical protein